MTDPCVDCQNPDGTCMWEECDFPADYVLRDVRLRSAKINGVVRTFPPNKPLRIGDIDVCGGHARTADRLKLVKPSQELIERAAARQA